MRKQLSFLLILLFLVQSVFSQHRDYKKLDKLYNKEKYTKCIRKAKKTIRKTKHRKEPMPYFYIAFANYELFKETSSKTRKKTYLRQSLNYAEKAIAKDKTGSAVKSNSLILSQLQISTNKYALTLYDGKRRSASKTFYDALAKVFKDTTEQYLTFHKKELSTEKVQTSVNSNEDSFQTHNELIINANKLIGVPYRYGGTSRKGLDCSGFTQYVYNSVGTSLPHSSKMQSQLGRIIDIKDAKPGDLIFFGSKSGKTYRIQHVGMIRTNDKGIISVIHCVSNGVRVDDMNSTNWTSYWGKRFLFVRRIIGENIKQWE